MQAGRELDDLVAQHVMGWELETENILISNYWKNENGYICYPRHFRPSEVIKDAWEVVREMVRKGTYVEITQGQEACMCGINYDGYWTVERCESAPRAICLAALKAVGIDIEKAV